MDGSLTRVGQAEIYERRVLVPFLLLVFEYEAGVGRCIGMTCRVLDQCSSGVVRVYPVGVGWLGNGSADDLDIY
jgi:hypothetical protein